MDHEDVMLYERASYKKTNIFLKREILHDTNDRTYVVKFIETESRIVVVRGWEEGQMGSYYLIGQNFNYIR